MLVDPKEVIDRGLARLPSRMDSRSARVMMHAIGRQESRFEVRRQHGNGPAAGFWQFERGGGVKGVLTHPASRRLAREACEHLQVNPIPLEVWVALQVSDELAAVFARLLLWTDRASLPLPIPDCEQAAWDCYIRNWRPGKPHRQTWGRFWRDACAAYDNTEVANA